MALVAQVNDVAYGPLVYLIFLNLGHFDQN